MESCSSAHHGARQLRRPDHDARIIVARIVIPYCRSGSGRNDGTRKTPNRERLGVLLVVAEGRRFNSVSVA